MFDLPQVGRIRCNRFSDIRGPGAVFRITPLENATAVSADLSLDIQALAVEHEGLLVVAGSRDSERQSVVNALVRLVSDGRPAYVITINREAAITHRGDGALISQREAPGGLTEILSVARAALQENPDLLVLEDVRNAELMRLAFDAAAGGHLIIAGFTAPSAVTAVQRIVELFPPEESRQVQLSLSHHLRGVLGQMLVPKIGGGLAAARELLLNNRTVSSLLAAGKVEHLGAAVAGGRQHGMIPLSDALADLVHNGIVDARDAYRQATDPIGLVEELKRRGIDTTFLKRFD